MIGFPYRPGLRIRAEKKIDKIYLNTVWEGGFAGAVDADEEVDRPLPLCRVGLGPAVEHAFLAEADGNVGQRATVWQVEETEPQSRGSRCQRPSRRRIS